MKALLATVLIFTTCAAVLAGPLTVTIRTYDPENPDVPKSTFHPGDQVLVRAKALFNDQAMTNKNISFTITASAKVAGIRVPYRVAQQVALPNKAPGDGSLVAHPGEIERIIQIPSGSPAVNASLVVRAVIGAAASTATARLIIVP